MADEDHRRPDSLEALAETVVKLRSERDGLREAMRNRAVIEQAKGMLAERLSVDPETAFRHLIEMSTRRNVKVAELAAAVLAPRQSEPPELDETTVAAAPTVPAAMDPPRPTAETVDTDTLGAELELIGGRVETATTFDELAESLAVATAAWPAPANVIVMLLEGDGALRLVGSAGLSATTRSQWDRLPPIENVPVVAAVRDRSPVYLADLEAVSRQFPVVADRPHEALVAMPLSDGDTVWGVLELTWARSPALTEDTRSRLLRLAEPAARRCRVLADLPDAFTGPAHQGDTVDTGLVSMFLEAFTLPAALLRPRYGDDGRLVDFDAEIGNAAAAPVITGTDGRPKRLLTALPEAGAGRLLPAFAATLRDGEPCLLRDVAATVVVDGRTHRHRVDVRANRIWDRLLVTWRNRPASEREHESLLTAERAFDIGAFEWDVESGGFGWTAGMFRLTGLDPAAGVPDVDAVAALIHPADRDELVAEAQSSLRADRSLHRELRGAGPLSGRTFAVTAEAELTADGELSRLRGACRDITVERRHTEQHRRGRVADAAVRAERDVLKSIVEKLRNPLPPQRTRDFELSGHTVAGADANLRSWYELVELSDGRIALTVGEVVGEEPTAPMLRLRLSTTGFVTSGMDPAEAVTAANTAFIATVPARAAALTVACLDPATGVLTWASAGSASPVLAGRQSPPGILPGSLGPPIGAAVPMRFPLNETELRPGDQLLLYSEGLAAGSGHPAAAPFDALRAASAADTAQAALARLAEADDPVDPNGSVLLARRR